MGTSSSKQSRECRITTDTSVAEAQLLLQQAIAATLEATEAATQAAAAARAAQLAAEEAVGTATAALVTLAAVNGKDLERLEVDAWISPPARVARPRSKTPVLDQVAIVAACDAEAGGGRNHRGHAAEGSGVGLAVGVGLAAPVVEQEPAGAAAAGAAAAGAAAGSWAGVPTGHVPTTAEEQALAALSDAWKGMRPAHLPVPLPPDVETVPLSAHVLTPPPPTALTPTLVLTLSLSLALTLALSLVLTLALAPALPFAPPSPPAYPSSPASPSSPP